MRLGDLRPVSDLGDELPLGVKWRQNRPHALVLAGLYRWRGRGSLPPLAHPRSHAGGLPGADFAAGQTRPPRASKDEPPGPLRICAWPPSIYLPFGKEMP
jgi:hypothetical protein